MQRANINFWLVTAVTFLLCGLTSLLCLSEFVKIGLLKQTNGYPFGGEGPVPWYYKTADLYASVQLFWGSVFLLVFAFAIWATVKKRKTTLLITFLSAIFLIVILWVSRQSIQ